MKKLVFNWGVYPGLGFSKESPTRIQAGYTRLSLGKFSLTLWRGEKTCKCKGCKCQ